jgi:FixJ family two-component response regulator
VFVIPFRLVSFLDGKLASMASLGHIHLVDDDQEIRLHMGNLLRQLNYGVSTFSSADEFLRKAIKVSPSVLLLDMRMPLMSGLELHLLLRKQNWTNPVIYMSGESHTQEIIDAMKGGAIDFLCKPFTQSQLIEVITKGLALDAQHHASHTRLLKASALHKSLSRKEQQIFSLMLLGNGNKTIASEIGLMPDTVKKHRAQIFEKMQVSSLAELLALCKDFFPSGNDAVFD